MGPYRLQVTWGLIDPSPIFRTQISMLRNLSSEIECKCCDCQVSDIVADNEKVLTFPYKLQFLYRIYRKQLSVSKVVEAGLLKCYARSVMLPLLLSLSKNH